MLFSLRADQPNGSEVGRMFERWKDFSSVERKSREISKIYNLLKFNSSCVTDP